LFCLTQIWYVARGQDNIENKYYTELTSSYGDDFFRKCINQDFPSLLLLKLLRIITGFEHMVFMCT